MHPLIYSLIDCYVREFTLLQLSNWLLKPDWVGSSRHFSRHVYKNLHQLSSVCDSSNSLENSKQYLNDTTRRYLPFPLCLFKLWSNGTDFWIKYLLHQAYLFYLMFVLLYCFIIGILTTNIDRHNNILSVSLCMFDSRLVYDRMYYVNMVDAIIHCCGANER